MYVTEHLLRNMRRINLNIKRKTVRQQVYLMNYSPFFWYWMQVFDALQILHYVQFVPNACLMESILEMFF